MSAHRSAGFTVEHPRAPRVRGSLLVEGDRMLAGAGERLRLGTQQHAAR